MMEIREKNKIWIIFEKQHFLFCEFKRAGYIVFDPYLGCNKLVPRLFRTAHFKSKIPFKQLWYRRVPEEEPALIIIREGVITEEYLCWIRKQFPRVKILGLFMNKIKDDNAINILQKYNCEATTGDPLDAEKYGITTDMSSVYLQHFKVQKKQPQEDVYYIGRAKKGRVDDLNRILKQLSNQGLTTRVHMVSPYPYGLTFGKYERPIPYSRILEELGKTKAILHLSQGAGSGITFRVMESVVNQIKLITDDVSIMDTKIYRRENVFIIGKDNWDRIVSFINTPFVPIETSVIDSLYFETDIKRYLEKSI